MTRSAGIALHGLLERLHECDGLNPPARAPALARLSRELAEVPERDTLLALYEDHDGSEARLEWRGELLGARLMAIDEALEASASMGGVAGELPDEVLWLATDDNSNYAGIFTSGPLAGFVTVLDHSGPQVAPRFRSIPTFMGAVLDAAAAEEEDRPCDLPTIPHELPVVRDDEADLQRFRGLAFDALGRWRSLEAADSDEELDLRRVWASAALCLLPVADTSAALELLEDRDMWTPELAVDLLELRDHHPAIPHLERLAREGTPNGDGAAMRALVRFGTAEAEAAVARLEKVLEGHKRAMLDQWRRWARQQ